MSKTPQDKGEIFSQKRMDRCADIFLQIQNASVRSGKWDYAFKATGPISGLTFDDFRKQYLLVGTTKKQREIAKQLADLFRICTRQMDCLTYLTVNKDTERHIVSPYIDTDCH